MRRCSKVQPCGASDANASASLRLIDSLRRLPITTAILVAMVLSSRRTFGKTMVRRSSRRRCQRKPRIQRLARLQPGTTDEGLAVSVGEVQPVGALAHRFRAEEVVLVRAIEHEE